MVSQLAVLGFILIEIGIQQKDRNRMPVGTRVNVEPRADPNRALTNLERRHCVERRARMGEVPPIGLFDLAPGGVDLLTKMPGVLASVTKTTGSSRSAQERAVSPASTPRPPE